MQNKVLIKLFYKKGDRQAKKHQENANQKKAERAILKSLKWDLR